MSSQIGNSSLIPSGSSSSSSSSSSSPQNDNESLSSSVVSEQDFDSRATSTFRWVTSLPNIIERYPPGENWSFQLEEADDNNEEEPSTSTGHRSPFPSCTSTSQSGQGTSENSPDTVQGSADNGQIAEGGSSHTTQVNVDENDEVWTVVPKMRRLFIEGVEVLYCTPARDPNLEHLLCSVCDHAVPKPKKVKKGTISGINKMKNHIVSNHNDHPREEEGTQLQFKCSLCVRAFRKKEFLASHMRAHQNKKKGRKMQWSKKPNRAQVKM